MTDGARWGWLTLPDGGRYRIWNPTAEAHASASLSPAACGRHVVFPWGAAGAAGTAGVYAHGNLTDAILHAGGDLIALMRVTACHRDFPAGNCVILREAAPVAIAPLGAALGIAEGIPEGAFAWQVASERLLRGATGRAASAAREEVADAASTLSTKGKLRCWAIAYGPALAAEWTRRERLLLRTIGAHPAFAPFFVRGETDGDLRLR